MKRKNILLFLIMIVGLLVGVVAKGNAVSEREMYEIHIPRASQTFIEKTNDCEVDLSNLTKGYVMVKHFEEEQKMIFEILGPDGGKERYTLHDSNKYYTIPLTRGNGDYQLTMYKNIEGTKYETVLVEAFYTSLYDDKSPFLNPNINVWFTENSNCVLKANELINEKDSNQEVVEKLYDFVLKTLEYDFEKKESVPSGYIPDPDSVMFDGNAICYDYASLLTAMIRSQGIPAQLCVGDVTDEYHAWVRWFDGEDWRILDPTLGDSNSAYKTKLFVENADNYQIKHIY